MNDQLQPAWHKRTLARSLQGRRAARPAAVIVFIPAVSQIEMDTYDKNVTATRHVGRLTGLRVTF